MRTLATIVAVAAAAAAFAIPAVATAATTASSSLSYEFDNGDLTGASHSWYWELRKNAASLNATTTEYGYADAGVVVDLGVADNFTGIDADTSGPMTVNVWIGDGSDASTPGQYSSADFSYGFEQSDGSFWMTSGPYAGQTLSPSQIAADFSGDEAYAWVGLTYSGQSVTGSVSAVNGHSIGNRTVGLTNNGDGTVTAAVH